MSEEFEILKLVTEKLGRADIPYMITGSIATNFYAVPRMTRDIDIVIQMKREECDQIFELFKEEFYIDQDSVIDALRQTGMFNIIHNKSVVKIDFIIRKDDPYRLVEFKRRREMNIEGHKIWVTSPEDLILSKLVWSKESLSEQQLNDVRNLLASAQNIDWAYIEEWVESLNIQEIYRKIKV